MSKVGITLKKYLAAPGIIEAYMTPLNKWFEGLILSFYKTLAVLVLLLSFISICLINSEVFAETKTVSSQTIGVTPTPKRVILPEWQYESGENNAITDVPGVKVGHVTISQDIPHVLRTGVTAILPHNGNLATTGLWASGHVLNGNGEVTGLYPLEASGILNSPILLTNTFAIGNRAIA